MKTNIKWNKVTWYSKLAAIIIFIGTFTLAFHFGRQYGELSVFCKSVFISQFNTETHKQKPIQIEQKNIVNIAKFSCKNNKTILSVFYPRSVDLKLNDGRNLSLNQTISASGARYANTDESFVFWNKGNTAFIEEGATTTYQNCVTK